MLSSPDVSVIIVNWKSADFLQKCLATIYRYSTNISFEIVVFDNASFDGSAKMVEKQFPEVRYIQSQDNLGFAQANNLAYAPSRGRYLLFLNPDTELVEGALIKMVACLDAFPRAGIVGPRLLNSDSTLQTSCIQSYPTILNQILDTEYLRRLFPRSSLWGNRALYESGDAPVKVQAVSGACLMARREAFQEVNHFTVDYFMYGEDVDLCYKVQSAGWDVLHLGSAVVVHHGGQSSSREPQNNFAAVMTRESLHRFMEMRRGKGYALIFRCAVAMIALLRLSVLGSAYVVALGQLESRSLRVAIQKWRSVLRWSVGLEGWAKSISTGMRIGVPSHSTK